MERLSIENERMPISSLPVALSYLTHHTTAPLRSAPQSAHSSPLLSPHGFRRLDLVRSGMALPADPLGLARSLTPIPGVAPGTVPSCAPQVAVVGVPVCVLPVPAR